MLGPGTRSEFITEHTATLLFCHRSLLLYSMLYHADSVMQARLKMGPTASCLFEEDYILLDWL